MNVLSPGLAHDIVTRTMRIIPFNVNVMDASGVILASGDRERVGALHDGALLALARKETVEVDAASARRLHGARPGINLPLMVDGQLCGAVGLSGEPDEVRQFGELVRLTAEMILEQASLAGELQRDSRYREAFVLNLIRADADADARPQLDAWARRLGLDLGRTQLVFLLELEPGPGGDEEALAEIQRLQLQLLSLQPGLLAATASPCEMIVLDAFETEPRTLEAQARRRQQALAAQVQEACRLPYTLTMGLPLPGLDGAAISYQSARSAARIGRRRQAAQRHPSARAGGARGLEFSYYDLALPVLLSGLGTGWQAAQLRLPMARLARDRSGAVLLRTLEAWFAHHGASNATAAALHIHRNTLDYRLRRIEELTGLALANMEDRLLLYVSTLLAPADA